MKDQKEYFYIYNFKQAKFFITWGLPVLDIKRGAHGDIYVLFERNENSEKAFIAWKRERYGDKAV